MTINEENKIVINVVKRDGKKVNFDASKIAVTIKKGFDSVMNENEEPKYNEKDIQKVFHAVLKRIEKEYKDLELTGGTVIGRDPVNAKEKFTVNVGAKDGIAKGDPVIAASGAVGVVYEVYDYSAEIVTIYSGNRCLSRELSH